MREATRHVAGTSIAGPVPAWMLRRYRHSPTRLLILGGSAGRRGRVARLFHEHGPARHGPLVRVDGVRDDAELRDALGCWLMRRHPLPGSRGLHAAPLGTLFLDHVEDLSPASQRLLLALLTAFPGRPWVEEPASWVGRIVAGASARLARALADGVVVSPLVDALDVLRVDLRAVRERGAA